MEFFICALIGYLFGTINPAYFIAKCKGFDIRKFGSKNAGTSNAVLTMGTKMGIIVGIIDIIKPMLAILVSYLIFKEYAYYKIITGAFAILGHMYPFYLKFKAGKGFACLIGFSLVYNPLFFLLVFVVGFGIAVIFDYIILATLTFSIVMPIFIAIKTGFDLIPTLSISLVCLIIIIKHIPNVIKIINHTETRFISAFTKKPIFNDKEENKTQTLENKEVKQENIDIENENTEENTEEVEDNNENIEEDVEKDSE